jgi:hypothetical protein
MNRSMHSPAPLARRLRSRGSTLAGVLWTIVLAGAVVATAAVITPSGLRARTPALPAEIAARLPEHQQVAELVAELIGRSCEVLAIHPRGTTPYLELVLWLEDAPETGTIDLGEVAVLSHSRVLQTMTFYVLDDDEAAAAEGLRREEACKPAFCRAWRDRRDVVARVIATGLSDVRAERLAYPDGRPGLLRIFFTWASQSSDGADEASILIDAAMSQQMES